MGVRIRKDGTYFTPETRRIAQRLKDWKHSASKRDFIGIDGEGENTNDGDHIYTLLCASDGTSIEASTGLDFQTCAVWLLGLQAAHPKANIVAYSFNYDVQMMLKSLPKATIIALWHEKRIRYKQYSIEWIPSKFLTLKRGKQRVQVWDTFGFYQMSFYRAILEWQVCSQEEADAILNMKDQRGDFANVDKQQIKAYCFKECELLQKLTEKLRDAFRTADIPLARFDGAGAAAAGLMRRNRVKDHLVRDSAIDSLSLRSYFGGRVELFRVGPQGTVYTADINSAYPYALTKLPSLHGEWKHVTCYDDSIPYALWRVEWNIPATEPLSPFPHRDTSGRIQYVYRGAGWYHSVEVQAAKALYGAGISVGEGYAFIPETDEKPFAFIESLYEERRNRKARGDVSQLPMKLAMNGISGKLAQGVGYNGKQPAYQCYYWAGLVTATTRAQILSTAYPLRHHLVGIATDGVFSLQPFIGLRESKNLGEYETGEYHDFFSAQAGVYQAQQKGKEIARNRGFATREIDWHRLRDAYARVGVGAAITYKPTRFVTVGGSLPELQDFGTWQARERKLSITYGSKWPYEPDAILDRNHAQYGVLYSGLPETYESQPYTPKATWTDFTDLDAYLAELEEW